MPADRREGNGLLTPVLPVVIAGRQTEESFL